MESARTSQIRLIGCSLPCKNELRGAAILITLCHVGTTCKSVDSCLLSCCSEAFEHLISRVSYISNETLGERNLIRRPSVQTQIHCC